MEQYTADFLKFTSAVATRMHTAIGSSLDLIARETKKVLSKTGPNAELQKAFGKRKTGPHSRAAGISAIQGLNQKKHGVYAGGTFTDSKGEKHDRIYWYGEPLKKWVQASAVGDPPHKQTGHLRNSVQRQLDRSPLGNVVSGKAGPLDKLVYARRHELGGPKNYPKRPFLLPVFNKLKTRIEARLKNAAKGGK